MTCPSIRAAGRKAHALPSERSTKATLAGLVLQLRQRRCDSTSPRRIFGERCFANILHG
jgi:hypothetical protein